MSLLTFWFLFLGECSMGLLYRLGICSRQLCLYPDAMVSIVIFLPELSADLREKVVKAGTEQKNWVERTKRIFICPDHTEMVAGKVIYFYRAFLVGVTKQNISLH